MTIPEAYQRADALMTRMRALERECHRLEACHAEVVAQMDEINDAMERLMWQATATHAYLDGDQELC